VTIGYVQKTLLVFSSVCFSVGVIARSPAIRNKHDDWVILSLLASFFRRVRVACCRGWIVTRPRGIHRFAQLLRLDKAPSVRWTPLRLPADSCGVVAVPRAIRTQNPQRAVKEHLSDYRGFLWCPKRFTLRRFTGVPMWSALTSSENAALLKPMRNGNPRPSNLHWEFQMAIAG